MKPLYRTRTVNTHKEPCGNSPFTEVGILTTKGLIKKESWINSTKFILSQKGNKQKPSKPLNKKHEQNQ